MVTWRNAPIKGCLHLVMMFLLKSCRIFFWVCFRKVRGMKHASKIKSSIYILSVPSFPLFDSSHNKWTDIHQMIQAAVTQTLIPKFVGLVTAKRVTMFSPHLFTDFGRGNHQGRITRDHATDATHATPADGIAGRMAWTNCGMANWKPPSNSSSMQRPPGCYFRCCLQRLVGGSPQVVGTDIGHVVNRVEIWDIAGNVANFLMSMCIFSNSFLVLNDQFQRRLGVLLMLFVKDEWRLPPIIIPRC